MMFRYKGDTYFPNQIVKIKEPIGKYEDITLYGKFKNVNTEYVVFTDGEVVRTAKVYQNKSGEFFVYNRKRYKPEMFK